MIYKIFKGVYLITTYHGPMILNSRARSAHQVRRIEQILKDFDKLGTEKTNLETYHDWERYHFFLYVTPDNKFGEKVFTGLMNKWHKRGFNKYKDLSAESKITHSVLIPELDPKTLFIDLFCFTHCFEETYHQFCAELLKDLFKLSFKKCGVDEKEGGEQLRLYLNHLEDFIPRTIKNKGGRREKNN